MTTTPASTTPDKPADAGPLIEELTKSLRETAAEVVPWFIDRMPTMYFQDTDHPTQLAHLRAIIAAKASGRPIELTLRTEDGSSWTSMRPLDYPGVLAELVAELPHDRPLRAAKIHTAADGQLVLDTFEFGDSDPFDATDPDLARKLEETMAYAAEHLPSKTEDDVRQHLASCAAEYVGTCTPLRIANNWQLFDAVSGTDGATIRLEPEADPTQCRITLAIANVRTRRMLERLALRLSRSSVNIHRAYLDIIRDGDNGFITLLGFVVQGPDGGAIDPEGALWQTLRHDLLRNKWLDGRVLNLEHRHQELDTTTAEITAGLCDLAHQVLVKANPFAFTTDRILTLAERNLQQTMKIVRLFLDRFNPDAPMSDRDFQMAVASLREELYAAVDLEDARIVLQKLLDAVCAVLRTNVYVEERYALSMRIDPAFMTTDERPEVPFGVFYVHGRDFNGFHVRFRDIARGGVRAIRTIGNDQHAREAERLYDEAYGLAFAQQLKNKDIPEGGAKAAVLLAPNARLGRSVKAFVDSILDLVTPDEATQSRIVDLFGKPELLYFGPDENITPEHIEWIVDRARRRGYPTPTALMSSKPGAGINHKEYGVTSEGVNVFLEVALRTVGIDPHTTPFTVKLTGGPDGDVGGNMMRILDRDYGGNAHVVGIADGSGVAEDPDGLDHAELLRLVAAELPISHFDRSRLGPNGRLVSIDEPEGIHLRNTMHNRVNADAFVPCGGRPNSVHGGNWRDYLGEDGQPTSKVIVEGANLFFTPDARNRLSDAGVLILKDSSANKCGVICSSFEIAACMLMNEAEFLQIKETFVAQVIDKLRDLARREAELLTRIHMHHPTTPLPEMSIRVSRVMIRVADAIEASMERIEGESLELLRGLVLDHLPPILVERVGDRLWKDTPPSYLRWMEAKTLAARIVYREGFEPLEAMPLEAIARLASKYLDHEVERHLLVEKVHASNLENRERIAELLSRAGYLTTLD